jgi:anti-sigma regulatory factor (Ser/Thr protein kinase)
MASPTIELKIPVLPNMELVATNAVEVVARHIGLSEEKAAEISMALIEATINAFEHGNPEHEVFIHFIMQADSLTVKVTDKGQGFEQSKLELPDIDKKIKKGQQKRGWGVALIQELVDIVDFDSTPDGTTVTMVKHKTDKS